jgi:hypothetical protein
LLLREIAGLRFTEQIPGVLPTSGLEDLFDADFWRHLVEHARQHREVRDRAFRAFPKICVLDLGLRASWLEEVVPLDPDVLDNSPPFRSGRSPGRERSRCVPRGHLPFLDVAHFPERPTEPEVDFVLTIGERRIPIEVKYRRRIDPLRDTLGLRAFLEKFTITRRSASS